MQLNLRKIGKILWWITFVVGIISFFMILTIVFTNWFDTPLRGMIMYRDVKTLPLSLDPRDITPSPINK